MKISPNPIYSYFFARNSWLQNIVQKTKWRNTISDNSYTFIGGKDKRKILNDVFGINIPLEKYNEAISGDGSEEKRITVLHSSSLAALLFFHNISDDYTLTVELDGDEYVFNEVHFERKTVVSGSHKSNMDVVLIGNSVKDEKKTVLFLECKFSEYLSSGKYTGISSDVYEETYHELGLDKVGTISKMIAKEPENGYFELCPKGNYQYCGGIKQMVSHYMGISNFINSGFKSSDEEDFSLSFAPDRILLAEVLFRLPQEVDDKNRLGQYEQAYKELAVTINNHNKNGKFHMVKESLTYDQLFRNHELPRKVKEFYNL